MNGYSKVVYELCHVLSKKDIKLSIFGFQNIYKNQNHRKEIPENIYVYDAFENENPKSSGFGFEQVNDFIRLQRPDIIIIYNDCVVISKIIEEINKLEKKTFKTVVYLDQVYPNIHKSYIEILNKHVDHVIVFSKYWEECIKNQGVTQPTSVLEHGINKYSYFPVPKNIARKYFGIQETDYVVLNLNRNQPRKRWDICMKVWAEIVKKYNDKPIKLLIGTQINGSWNLLEIYEHELKKRNLTLEDGMKHIILLDNAQLLSDTDINTLYNTADLGITTCDGEGWGLCSFEHAYVGVPQIVPKLGGFLDFFNDDNVTFVEPSWAYYVDNTRDLVGGEASVCNYMDFVEAIELHYNSKSKQNKNIRKDFNTKYSWDIIGDKFIDIINKISHKKAEKEEKTQKTETIHLKPEIIDNDTINENQYVTKEEFKEVTQKLDALISLLNRSQKDN
jgi:glycosyltransferase involved in cell wall biosynthesis